ncbi:MAG: hypothetical protein WCP20_12070 [Desulfuromonadales bacterium]
MTEESHGLRANILDLKEPLTRLIQDGGKGTEPPNEVLCQLFGVLSRDCIRQEQLQKLVIGKSLPSRLE